MQYLLYKEEMLSVYLFVQFICSSSPSVCLSTFFSHVYINICIVHLCTQDPLKEKETEMMMDYIERFNEVTN